MAPIETIKTACLFDTTLKASNADLRQLESRYLQPVHYQKKILFDAMSNGKTVVFDDYPIAEHGRGKLDKTAFTLKTLKQNLNQHEVIYIRYGTNRTLKKVTISEVIDRWARQRSKFGVTDLHFRKTRYFNKVDAGSISYFNLLPAFSEDISFLEMLTLVISSRGIFSDSHSDDGDGSNHCIVGKKLWFAWDKEEGASQGLQDCTYDPVYTQAKFSIKKFLSLKSSHWFIISEGRTLFMPGNFTHKVVTLEPYIGFGSFYLSLPNYINSLKRWILRYSSDVNPTFIERLQQEFPRFLQKKLSTQTPAEREKTGYSYFVKALKNWKEGLTQEEQQIFQEKAAVAQMKECVNAIAAK